MKIRIVIDVVRGMVYLVKCRVSSVLVREYK